MSQSESSDGNVGGAGRAGARADYFIDYICYRCSECRGRILIRRSLTTSEIICPRCSCVNSGFLEEESENHPSPPNAIENLNTDPDRVPISICIDLGRYDDRKSNPSAFLDVYIDITGNILDFQLIFECNSSEVGFQLPSNEEDYILGPSLEQFIDHLEEDDSDMYDTHPASRSAVEALPGIKITSEFLNLYSSDCSICKEIFELDEDAIKMPCEHIYHSGCILRWLELHNTCPICRDKLPTDDPDYENRRTGHPFGVEDVGTSSASGSSVSGSGAEIFEVNPHSTFWLGRIRQLLSRAQELSGNSGGENINNASNRLVNMDNLSFSLVSSSNGASNVNDPTPMGRGMRIRISLSVVSRAQPAEIGNNGESNSRSTAWNTEEDLD